MMSSSIMGSQVGTQMQQQLSRMSQIPLPPSMMSEELLSHPMRSFSHKLPSQLPVSSYIICFTDM